MSESPASVYEAVGGTPFFENLTHVFYAHVATDPVLEPMYPAHDMAGAERRLCMFLEQYWGGPTTYSQERGHPRLRMRHNPYPIDAEAREHWLAAMEKALDEAAPSPEIRAEMWDYFARAATAMVNVFPGGHGSLLGRQFR